MRFRKRARMMQPPRQIVASSPRSRSQSYVLRGGGHLLEALRVGDDLRGVERLADVVDERLGAAARPGCGPASTLGRGRALVAQRRQRAREHRLGDRRSAARRARARPAPSSGRCPSARPGRGSRRPAACRSPASVLPSTVAVISIRNDSRSPSFQSSKISRDRRHARARRRGAAGRRPRRSAACRRTRCRCGPSSRSGPRRRRRCRRSTASPSTCAAIVVKIVLDLAVGLARRRRA